MDNRWVIPYSPFLLVKVECHISVELTFNVRSIKYIHKYWKVKYLEYSGCLLQREVSDCTLCCLL